MATKYQVAEVALLADVSTRVYQVAEVAVVAAPPPRPAYQVAEVSLSAATSPTVKWFDGTTTRSGRIRTYVAGEVVAL